MWGLPPPFSDTGLADGRPEHRLRDTIERCLVNIEGRVWVSQEQLEGGNIIPIKRNSDRNVGQLGAVLGLAFGLSHGLTGAGATSWPLHGEQVCGLIVVDVFHWAAFNVTVTVINYRHRDAKSKFLTHLV